MHIYILEHYLVFNLNYLGNIPVTKQMVHQQAGNHSITAGNSFTGVQTLASSNNDRAANSQNAQSTALNFMQHQQQQVGLTVNLDAIK